MSVATERCLIAVLFCALAAQLGYGLWTDGATADEVTYIGAGYRHLHGDFRIDPDHPPLAKMIVALPLLALGVTMADVRPEDDQDGWGDRFVNEVNRGRPVVRTARLAVAGLTLALAALLWIWARQVGGPTAGLLALSVAAFQPGFLAHGHLGTTDVACALFMLSASYAYWRFEQTPSVGRAALTALAAGLAFLARSTTLLLLPIFAVLVLRRFAGRGARGEQARALVLLAAAHAVVVPVLIWAVYGFRYAPWAGDAGLFGGPWPKGLIGRVLPQLAAFRLLPQAYIEGIRFQLHHQAFGHPSYLLGRRSKDGWWYYDAVVLLVKNTPGFLALASAGLIALRKRWSAVTAHWLVPAALTFAAASAARVQLGERYILPVYAYVILCIATSLAPHVAEARARWLIGGALALHVAPVLAIAPSGYLTYFNAVAGGPKGGHHWLADSNLDWGQDLPRLAAWMRARGVPHVQLGYFGADDPSRYGIAHDDLPTWPHTHRDVHPPVRPFTGTVVVSPNLALGYLFPPDRNPYAGLRGREPDERAGIFFVYRFD